MSVVGLHHVKRRQSHTMQGSRMAAKANGALPFVQTLCLTSAQGLPVMGQSAVGSDYLADLFRGSFAGQHCSGFSKRSTQLVNAHRVRVKSIAEKMFHVGTNRQRLASK